MQRHKTSDGRKVFCMPTSAFKAVSRAFFLSWVAMAVDLLRSRLQHTQNYCGCLHSRCLSASDLPWLKY